MVAARTGATAQAAKTRARARQGAAVDAGDGGTDGSGLRLARDAVAQGSASAVAVNTDAGDGGSGGSWLRLARALRKPGRGEDEVCEKPTPPPFISHQRPFSTKFRYYSEFEPSSPPALQNFQH